MPGSTPYRRPASAALRCRRCRNFFIPRDRQYRREMKSRAAAGRAGDGQIAAHAFGQRLDDAQAEARAAIALGDLDTGLGEWPEQPTDLGAGKPDAAVAHDAVQPRAPSLCRLGAQLQFDRTLV